MVWMENFWFNDEPAMNIFTSTPLQLEQWSFSFNMDSSSDNSDKVFSMGTA